MRKALPGRLSAIRRRESKLGRFYQRLRRRGKPGKVALVAVMRKLLMQLHAVAQRGPWLEDYSPAIVQPTQILRRRPESRGAVGGEVPRCIGGQAGLPRAPAPRFVIPAPHLVMPAPPTSSFRRRPESRGAVRSVARPGCRRPRPAKSAQDPPVIPAPRFVTPAPHFVMPAPHFVIPAKAGIQREGRFGDWAGRAEARSHTRAE